VWVLGAFRDAVIAAVIMSVRGWMALLWSPWESMRLIAALRLNLPRACGLLADLLGPGLAVETPPDGTPMLRTVIVGAGDLITRVAEGPTLMPALVAFHFKAVQQRLEPLAATLEALLRVVALGMAAMTAYYVTRNPTLWSKTLPNIAFDVFGSAFIVSFISAFLVRLVAQLSARLVHRWLDRESQG